MEAREFNFWKARYDANDLAEFNFNAAGLLWLKLKSLTRKGLLDDFIAAHSIDATRARTLAAKWEVVFNLLQKQDEQQIHQTIDDFIHRKSQAQIENFDEQALVSELYKLKFYDWGGDYKNNLDKYLVDSFIKVYRSYDELSAKIEGEIARSVAGYVLNSWYNHWSSILIENIFKAHKAVLPTVGQIKKVDFFIRQIPFDLKVTYLPANFIEEKRKSYGLRPELTELKQQARKLSVTFQTHKKASDTYYEIVQKLQDRDSEASLAALKSIDDVRKKILDEARAQPQELVKNLYEKQGEMRFDASNRLFLILVDSINYNSSWKLRRNLDLLKPTITQYLDDFDSKNIEGLRVDFRFADKEYTCLADCLFVTK